MRQLSFANIEHLAADAAEAATPDEAFELCRCVDCGRLWPKAELHYGLCENCGGPFDDLGDRDLEAC